MLVKKLLRFEFIDPSILFFQVVIKTSNDSELTQQGGRGKETANLV